MKKLFLLLMTIVILSACSSDNNSQISQENSNKPKIPHRPKIAQANLEANLLGSTDTQKEMQEESSSPETDMSGLIERINENLEQSNITVQDVERGWYYGSENERKIGTPNTWIWVDEGERSHWISPTALDQLKDIRDDKLCRETGGYYVISCMDRDLPLCENISKSECKCQENTKWQDLQGCVLIDKDGKFVEISSSDVKQGWYAGPINGKKFNTPSNWIWSENGNDSKWKNPGAF